MIALPEKYSHDKLEVIIAEENIIFEMLQQAVRKGDNEEQVILIQKIAQSRIDFQKAFEQHDLEMFFVEKLVNFYTTLRSIGNFIKWAGGTMGASLIGAKMMGWI